MFRTQYIHTLERLKGNRVTLARATAINATRNTDILEATLKEKPLTIQATLLLRIIGCLDAIIESEEGRQEERMRMSVRTMMR